MRVAVITGAAQGIGRRIAEVLAARGYTLALSDLRPPVETTAAVRQLGADTIELVGDISNDAIVGGFAEIVLARWGSVDVLVNNAGISCIAAAERTTPQEFRRVLEVNLVAPFLMARAFGPSMLARRSGTIVNIASVAGLLGIAERSAYNTSKHGLIGLTRTLAAEWGGRGVANQRGLPRVGEDRDGRDGPGQRPLHGCRHHRSHPARSLRVTGRCRECRGVPGRPGAERIRQRRHVDRGWRLDERRELAVAARAASLRSRARGRGSRSVTEAADKDGSQRITIRHGGRTQARITRRTSVWFRVVRDRS